MKEKTVSFNVAGMHCTSCEEVIKDSLLEQQGIKSVTVSHKTGKLEVSFDENYMNEEKIKQVVSWAGFVAK